MDSALQPIVWKICFPADIEEKCQQNGGIMNSYLKLAGLLLHYLVLEWAVPDLCPKQAAAWCDNTSSVAKVRKLAAKQSLIAGRLLCGLAMRARVVEILPMMAVSIAGTDNITADVLSHSLRKESGYIFSNGKLLSHFNTSPPLAQKLSWRSVTPASAHQWNVLHGARLPLALRMTHAVRSSGGTGAGTLSDGDKIDTSIRLGGTNAPASLSTLLRGSGEVTLVEEMQTSIRALIVPSAQLARYSR